MRGPYTPKSMEAARAGSDALGSRFEGLHAEATAAVGYSANTMRTLRERYRAAYSEALGHWQSLRDELEAAERAPRDARPRVVDATFDDDAVAAAAETGAADARLRALRGEVEALGSELGAHRSKLAELELAEQSLERTWLFLGQGDGSLVEDDHPSR